jgi:hypothetical protein
VGKARKEFDYAAPRVVYVFVCFAISLLSHIFFMDLSLVGLEEPPHFMVLLSDFGS